MCTAGDSEVNSSEFPLGNHKSEYDLCRDTPIPDRMKAGGQKMLVVHGGGGRDTLRSHMAQPQEGIIWLAMNSSRFGWTFRSRQNHGSSWQTSCRESFT